MTAFNPTAPALHEKVRKTEIDYAKKLAALQPIPKSEQARYVKPARIALALVTAAFAWKTYNLALTFKASLWVVVGVVSTSTLVTTALLATTVYLCWKKCRSDYPEVVIARMKEIEKKIKAEFDENPDLRWPDVKAEYFPDNKCPFDFEELGIIFFNRALGCTYAEFRCVHTVDGLRYLTEENKEKMKAGFLRMVSTDESSGLTGILSKYKEDIEVLEVSSDEIWSSVRSKQVPKSYEEFVRDNGKRSITRLLKEEKRVMGERYVAQHVVAGLKQNRIAELEEVAALLGVNELLTDKLKQHFATSEKTLKVLHAESGDDCLAYLGERAAGLVDQFIEEMEPTDLNLLKTLEAKKLVTGAQHDKIAARLKAHSAQLRETGSLSDLVKTYGQRIVDPACLDPKEESTKRLVTGYLSAFTFDDWSIYGLLASKRMIPQHQSQALTKARIDLESLINGYIEQQKRLLESTDEQEASIEAESAKALGVVLAEEETCKQAHQQYLTYSDNELRQCDATIAGLQKEVAALNAEQEKSTKAVQILRNTVGDSASKLKQLKAEKNQQRNLLQIQRVVLAGLETQIVSLNTNKVALEGQKKQIEGEIRENEKLKVLVKASEDSLRKLNADLKELQGNEASIEVVKRNLEKASDTSSVEGVPGILNAVSAKQQLDKILVIEAQIAMLEVDLPLPAIQDTSKLEQTLKQVKENIQLFDTLEETAQKIKRLENLDSFIADQEKILERQNAELTSKTSPEVAEEFTTAISALEIKIENQSRAKEVLLQNRDRSTTYNKDQLTGFESRRTQILVNKKTAVDGNNATYERAKKNLEDETKASKQNILNAYREALTV